MTTAVLDYFTDADSTSLDAHTPDTDVSGNGWTEQIGNWQITGNQVGVAVATSNSTATIAVGQANCVLSCEAKSTGTNVATSRDVGVVARYVDANNQWIIGINAQGDTWRIVEVNGGVINGRASASVAIDPTTFYSISVTLNGQTISATLDGANNISYGSAALNVTGTIHGMHMRETGDRIDDFQAEYTAAESSSVSPSVSPSASPSVSPSISPSVSPLYHRPEFPRCLQ